ncbi:MAG: extracellular solute-binding protein [Planctomycetes bacterium]|nr:extracellular solute-binding protein [Planctomycetota bacterium]
MTARPLRLLVLPVAVLVAGCSDRPHVVLYVSADDHVARPIVRAFERQSGIRVDMVGDTEQRKTTGLANRLLAERDNPQADVFWSSEVFHTIRLAGHGVFAGHDSAVAGDRPAVFRDPGHLWHGFGARARVIVYAPDRVEPEHVPRTWMGLTDERFRGRIVMADPRFGTTGGHLAAMKVFWAGLAGMSYYEAFLMGLADNRVRLLPGGNAGVVRAVADGEADLGLTDTDDVWAAVAAGHNVRHVYPRHAIDGVSGGGTLLIPNTVARVANGPNPQPAAALIDFLLSDQVERMLAESTSHNIPVRAAIAAEFPEYAVPDPLEVNLSRVAALMPGAIDQAMRLLDDRDAP